MNRRRAPGRASFRRGSARWPSGRAFPLGRGKARQRVSPATPWTVTLLAALSAGVAVPAVVWRVLSVGQIPWALLALGLALAGVSLTAALMGKRVQLGKRHYAVSNFFKSEAIAFHDVCMVVEAPGVFWKTVRIHLRRPSRFGWEVTFVPRRATETSPTRWRKAGAVRPAGPAPDWFSACSTSQPE